MHLVASPDQHDRAVILMPAFDQSELGFGHVSRRPQAHLPRLAPDRMNEDPGPDAGLGHQQIEVAAIGVPPGALIVATVLELRRTGSMFTSDISTKTSSPVSSTVLNAECRGDDGCTPRPCRPPLMPAAGDKRQVNGLFSLATSRS